MNDVVLWIAIPVAAFAVLFAVALVRTRSLAWRQKQLLALSTRVDLAVPEALEPELLRVVARRQGAWSWAFALAWVAGFLVVGAGSGAGASSLSQLIAPVSFAVAGAVAVAVVMIDPRRTSFGNPVARLERVKITDLVPSRAIGLVVGVVAVAVSLAALQVVTSGVTPAPDGATSWTALGSSLAAIAAALLAMWVVASRAIAAMRPLSGDAATLAWSDALRAESVRDLLAVPALPAMIAVPLLAAELARGALPDPNMASVVSGVAVYATLALAIVMLIVMLDHRTTRHFRRALWPAPQPESGTIAS